MNASLGIFELDEPRSKAGTVEKYSFGSSAINYFHQMLPHRDGVGGAPGGYLNDPGYREWRKARHEVGTFSYGPYYVPESQGELSYLAFVLEITKIHNPDDNIATFDLVDYNNEGRDLVNPYTARGRDVRSSGLVVRLGSPIEISPRMKIESRIHVHGGADLRLYRIHYTVAYP